MRDELRRSGLEPIGEMIVSGGARASLVVRGAERLLAVAGVEGVEGEPGPGGTVIGGLTPANAAAMRACFEELRPRPLGTAAALGMGDRIGCGTPGHIEAARRSRVTPVLAQQSMREMKRVGRSSDEVMADVTWGLLREGRCGIFGSDADHLKTPDDVKVCAAAGFTMFTVDLIEWLNGEADALSGADLEAAVEKTPGGRALISDYTGRRIVARPPSGGEPVERVLEGQALARAVAVYGGALDRLEEMHAAVAAAATVESPDFEVSIDETETPTTLEALALVMLEARRRGIVIHSFAPRFVGAFEKAVDYRGDLGQLRLQARAMGAIAAECGPAKCSIHSGSDKFSAYPVIAEETGGLVHVKTAGTSYLEALRVLASHEPVVFREVLRISHESFERDRATYHLSCDVTRVPRPGDLADDQLPGLLDDDDARQVMHVAYGSVLARDGADMRGEVVAAMERHYDVQKEFLVRHFVKHAELAGLAGRSF